MAAVVTKYGFQETAKLMTAIDSPTAWQYLALGTGSATENTDVSKLATEVTDSGMARVVGASITIASSVTQYDTAKYEHTWTATASKSIKETGVFNTSVANQGDLLCYATFANAIDMQSDDTLKVTWSVQVKAG